MPSWHLKSQCAIETLSLDASRLRDLGDALRLGEVSANGNPRLSTLFAVAKAVGLKLTVEAA
ncbi:MAG TPA: hypothetical protein VNE63_02190 [Candidatus Acidoferrales bacterium]|nr:hypothetical protein [Candidatus Acidoferrales bacterium]